MTDFIERARALDCWATEGPWSAWTDQDGQPHMNHMLMVGNSDAVIPEGQTWVEGVDVNPVAHTYTPEDREFIAAARSMLPAAVEALARVRELHTKSTAARTLPLQMRKNLADGEPHHYCAYCAEVWPCETYEATEVDA